jgi:hypothetical protein
MSYVPNELNVTLNTNMPGFSKLTYKPDMTIKGLKSKNIQFNPLIKLNDAVVKDTYAKLKQIKPNMLISELFLDKSYFNTLLSYHKSQKWIKNITLEQAHQEGNVDNNIKITLKYVFETRSLIYLKDDPYSIGALNWTNGDWKLDTKEKAQALSTNPYLRSAMITSNIISGEGELRALKNINPDLVQGPNYVPDPSIIAAGVNIVPIIPAPAPIIKPVPTPVIPTPIIKPVPTPVIPTPIIKPVPAPVIPTPIIKPVPAILPAPIPAQNLPASKTLAITNVPDVEILPDEIDSTIAPPVFSNNEVSKMRLPIMLYNMKYKKDIDIPSILKYVSDKDIDVTNWAKIKKKSILIDEILNSIKTSSTKKIQTYFKGDFYKLLNSIYMNFDTNIKTSINDVFKTQTPINVSSGKNLSKAAYESVIESLNVYPNKGQGDCFFIAIADAINNYNHFNRTNKITYDKYGIGSRIFTVAILRTIVYEYIRRHVTPDEIKLYVDLGVINAQRLNDRFKDVMSGKEVMSGKDDSAAEYLNTVNEVYGSDEDPIFVLVPSTVPITMAEYDEPFLPVTNAKIENFIKSNNYWADQIAIYAMANLLKINVIVLNEKIVDGIVSLESLCNIDDNTSALLKDWDKYVFLYHSGGHYELVTFNFTRLTPDKKFMPIPTITIFNRYPPKSNKQIFYIVPYYIILCMFGSCYYTKKYENGRQNFDFLQLQNINVFEITNGSITKMVDPSKEYNQTPQSYNRVEFVETFNRYFPGSDIPIPQDLVPIANEEIGLRKSPRLNEEQNAGGKEESDICYAIKIDLMLRKGVSITDEELNTLLCNARYNEISKPMSTIFNTVHSIRPDITLATITPDLKNESLKNESLKNNKKDAHNKTKKIR